MIRDVPDYAKLVAFHNKWRSHLLAMAAIKAVWECTLQSYRENAPLTVKDLLGQRLRTET